MKKAAQRVLGWFGTLSGRLTILLLVGLAIAQVATILYVLNSVERDRALAVDRAFFATLARAAQTIPTVPPPDRARVLRTMQAQVFFIGSRGAPLSPQTNRSPRGMRRSYPRDGDRSPPATSARPGIPTGDR